MIENWRQAILTLLAILALLTFVFIIFFSWLRGSKVQRFKGSFRHRINPSTPLRTSGSTMLTIDGSARLTTSRVHIWSPIYMRGIQITIKVLLNLAGLKRLRFKGLTADKTDDGWKNHSH